MSRRRFDWLRAAASGAIAPPAPSWIVPPSITTDGTPTVGETVTGNDGTIAVGAVSARAWLRNGSAISGANGASYVLQAEDTDQEIAFRVTATGPGGFAQATSAAIVPSPTPTPTPTPTPSAWSITKTDALTQSRYDAKVTSPFASKWGGYSNQAITNSYPVNSNTAFGTAYTNAKNAAAMNPGIWQEIVVQTGVTAMLMGDADFFPYSGGGLIIRPEVDAMNILGLVGQNGCPRGVQIGKIGCGFTFCSTTAGGNGQLRFNTPGGSTYTVIKITGNRFGLNTPGSGYVNDSPELAELLKSQGMPIRFFHGEDVQIVDNVFNGVSNSIDVFSVRLAEITRNDFQQFSVDIVGVSAFWGGKEFKGLLADDHQYVWAHNNTVHNIMDWYQYSPANQGPHCDFMQLRTTCSYPGNPTVSVSVVEGKWCAANGNYYKCITPGNTAVPGVAPSGTGSDIVDGTVHWQYVCALSDGPACYITIESNQMIAAATDYADAAGARFAPIIGLLTISDPQRHGVLVLNNIECTRSSFGAQAGGPGLEYADAAYNTLVPTSELPPSGGMNVADPAVAWVFVANTDYSKVRAYRNICAGGGGLSGANFFDNIIVSIEGSDPGLVLNGTFHQQDGWWLMDFDDDPALTPAEFSAALYDRVRMRDGSDYGAVV